MITGFSIIYPQKIILKSKNKAKLENRTIYMNLPNKCTENRYPMLRDYFKYLTTINTVV